MILSAPWWLVVLLRFGPGPLIAAISGSAQAFPIAMGLLPFLSLAPVTEPWFPFFTGLGLLGLADCIGRRRWLLPAWTATILVVNYRGPVDRAVILVSLLAGVGLAALVDVLRGVGALTASGSPELRSNARKQPQTPATEGRGYGYGRERGSFRIAVPWRGVIVGVAAVALIARSVVATWTLATAAPLALSTGERSAMAWAGKHTGVSSRFSIVTSATWAIDANSEWFPALSGRTSVATIQGTEWIPHVFASRLKVYQGLQACSSGDAGCLMAWSHKSGVRPNYVYVAANPPEVPGGNPTSSLASSLAQSGEFHIVFRNRAVTIFRWLAGGTPVARSVR
jgi:hypothetical protein